MFPLPPGISGCLWVCGKRPKAAGSRVGGGFALACSLSLWVGGPVIWAIVRGMDVIASGFPLQLRACGPGLS